MIKLLIVDDSTIIRRKIERATREHGLEIVASARNGVEAVEACRRHRPELVTMDLTMPEMDGIRCIGEILALCPDALILVISALADKATAIEALKRGAHGFLHKPFTEQALTQALDELIRGAV